MSTVSYADERVQAEIQVRPATYLDGIRRTRLILSASETYQDSPESDLALLACFSYPDLIAASPSGTLTVDGEAVAWPPPVEVVAQLPNELGRAWEEAVYRLNPAFLKPPETDEKKATSTSPG